MQIISFVLGLLLASIIHSGNPSQSQHAFFWDNIWSSSPWSHNAYWSKHMCMPAFFDTLSKRFIALHFLFSQVLRQIIQANNPELISTKIYSAEKSQTKEWHKWRPFVGRLLLDHIRPHPTWTNIWSRYIFLHDVIKVARNIYFIHTFYSCTIHILHEKCIAKRSQIQTYKIKEYIHLTMKIRQCKFIYFLVPFFIFLFISIYCMHIYILYTLWHLLHIYGSIFYVRVGLGPLLYKYCIHQ